MIEGRQRNIVMILATILPTGTPSWSGTPFAQSEIVFDSETRDVAYHFDVARAFGDKSLRRAK